MKYRVFLGAAIAMLVVGIERASADDWNGPMPDPDGRVALAERMEVFAHQNLRQDKLPAKALEMSAALYRAASKLDPTEPRYLRSLADILLEVNQGAEADEVLKLYLNMLPPSDLDQTALVESLDLHLASGKFQGADEKLKFLHGVMSRTSLPAPVRSEAAVRAANLLLDRSQTDDAIKMLDTALQLNPVNLTALRAKYVLTQATALPIDRVQQLMGILQANPADPIVASRLAEQLAQLGLVDQSSVWYEYARQMYAVTGITSDAAFALGASSEYLLADHPKESVILANLYSKAFPGSADAWFIVLSAEKYITEQNPSDTDAKASYADYLRAASIGLVNRLQEVRFSAGDKTATTRPLDSDTESTLPDVSGDAAMLKSQGKPALTDAYILSANALAWFDVYYKNSPADADPLLKVLQQLQSPKETTLQRLLAWQKYAAGDANSALPVLQSLASQDPLSAMGAIRIEMADPTKAPAAIIKAQRLLNEHPAGVIGAVIYAEFANARLTVDPSPDSGPVATLVANVPDRLLQMVTQARAFYVARVDPVKPSYAYGEPILVRVSIQNISPFNIAIGDECAIHPSVWFDAFLRGMMSNAIPGIAVGRLDKKLMLAPGESFSTEVRLDSDLLSPTLNQNATFDLMLNITMAINPVQFRSAGPGLPDQTQYGPCGYIVRMSRMLERTSTPIDTDVQRKALTDRLQGTDGGDQMRVMELMTTFVSKLQDKQDAEAQKIVTDFHDALRKTPTLGKPCVQAWKRFMLAMLLSGDDQVKEIQAMAKDPEWQTRLMCILACQNLGAPGIQIAGSLTSDSDPNISAYAKAMSESLSAAATQPSAPPTVMPSPGTPPPSNAAPPGNLPPLGP